MKRDNNSVILWVVLAAAVLVGVYLFKDKLGICWSGNCKTETQEVVAVEATEPVSAESEMPMAPEQTEDVAAVVAEEVK